MAEVAIKVKAIAHKIQVVTDKTRVMAQKYQSAASKDKPPTEKVLYTLKSINYIKEFEEKEINTNKNLPLENNLVNLHENQPEVNGWTSERLLNQLVDHGWGEFNRDPDIKNDCLAASFLSEVVSRPTKTPTHKETICNVCYDKMDGVAHSEYTSEAVITGL